VEIAPDSTKKTGKKIASYELIDYAAIPDDEKAQYASDDQGVLHKILKEKVYLNPMQMQNVNSYGYYSDLETGETGRVQYDASGNPYYYGGKQSVEVYKPGTTEKIKLNYQPGQPVESYGTYASRIQLEAEKKYEKEQMNKIPKVDATMVLPQPLSPMQKVEEAVRPVVENVQNVVRPAIEPVKKAVQKLPQPLQQSPVQYAAQKMPEVVNAVKQAPISYAVQKVASQLPQQIQQAVQSLPAPIRQAPIQYAAQQVSKAIPEPVKQTVKNIATTIKTESPFSFLKKKLGW
jgi:hypothetical protein